jgi:molecular chaperone DnaJ
MAKRDYYDVLGVDKSSDAATIKKAYRKLACNFILTKTPITKKQKPNSKKPVKPMKFE